MMRMTEADKVLAARLGQEQPKTRLVSYHDAAFARAVRHHVLDQGMTLSDWIDRAMRHELEREQEEARTPTAKPF